ncbi:MAG: hypothetical protein RIR91_721, partial [Verrucomicrobiota bacterium]
MSNVLGNMPPVFGSGYRGVVPAPSAADVSAQNILRADGTWGAGPSGTLPSQTGNSGELLTTDGTNASWTDSLNNFSVSNLTFGVGGPNARSSIAARAGTSGVSVANLPAFGTGDFTIAAWIRRDDSLDWNILGGGTNSWRLSIRSGGTLFTGVQGVSNTGDSTGTVPTGKMTLVTCRRSSGFVYFGFNGVEEAGQSYAGNATVASTLIGCTDGLTTQVASGFLAVNVYNRALSSSEVVALYEAGAPAGADYNTASNTAVYSTDFSTSTGWVAESGWSITGGAAVLSGSSAGALFRTATALNPLSRYRITFTVASYVSGEVKPWIQIGSSRVRGTARTANGTYTEELVAPSATGTSYVGVEASTSSSCSLSVDDYAYYAAGLLLAPDAGQAGGGTSWYDTSGNSATITLPASGVTWNVPTSSKTATGWTFGGNLTVSGTGTSTFSSIVDINNDLYIGAGNILA